MRQQQLFDDALVERISAEVRRLRTERKLSAQKLADRTSELGHTVTRATIAELETGRRKYISLTELILLAAALEVPVVDLVYPGSANTEIEILPNVRVPKVDAVASFSGSRQLDSKLVAMLDATTTALKLATDEIVELRSQIAQLWNGVEVFTGTALPGEFDAEPDGWTPAADDADGG